MSTSANDSGNNGGCDSTDFKSLLVFGLAYGIATTITVKTIDFLTSGRRSKKEELELTTPPPNKRTSNPPHLPPHCKYVFEFYKDCLRNKKNNCDPFRDVIRKCQEAAAGVSSRTSPLVNDGFPVGLYMLSATECHNKGSSEEKELYKRYWEDELQYGKKWRT